MLVQLLLSMHVLYVDNAEVVSIAVHTCTKEKPNKIVYVEPNKTVSMGNFCKVFSLSC